MMRYSFLVELLLSALALGDLELHQALCKHYKLGLWSPHNSQTRICVPTDCTQAKPSAAPSHPGAEPVVSPLTLAHISAAPLGSSHSDRTRCDIEIGNAARMCSFSNNRWTRRPRLNKRKPLGLLGLSQSTLAALSVCAANTSVSRKMDEFRVILRSWWWRAPSWADFIAFLTIQKLKYTCLFRWKSLWKLRFMNIYFQLKCVFNINNLSTDFITMTHSC